MRPFAVAILAGALGCNSCRGVDPPGVPGTPLEGTSSSAVVASPEAPRPPSHANDPRWRRAMGDDPIEIERLALAVGAAELLEGVEEGGEPRRVALLALPHADDSDIALRRLGEIATAAKPGTAAQVLDAMLGIARRPRTQRELLDPEGVRAAGAALVAIASRPQAPREERALAVSAARALAERGYVDPTRIPPDLDP